MKVAITGGSGFIGGHLISALLVRRHQVVVFDHHPPSQDVGFFKVHLSDQELPHEMFEGVDAVIHLAGKSIFGRWNKEVKKAIYESRILGTRGLVSSLGRLTVKPSALVSASAVGYYGDKGEEDLDEDSRPGSDFLARVCADWENEARNAEGFGVRTVQVRTAPVLGHDGLLAKITPMYRLGLGGPLGNGRQWFPWIHLKDIVDTYVFVLEKKDIRGPVNACAPTPTRNLEFSRALARVLRRPHIFRTPRWALKLLWNDLGDAIMVSQKVHPEALAKAGYKFSFPEIYPALENLFRPPRSG